MRTAPALILATLVALTLTSCTPDAEPITPDPEPSASPIFASDEEALAAAEAAYGAYQLVEDEISGAGGVNADRLQSVSVGAALASALEGMSTYEELGYRSIGTTQFRLPALQQYDVNAEDGVGVVSAYLCLDLSQLDVVDALGNSVVSPTRPDSQAFEVTFDLVDLRLVLATREAWDGGGVCEAR